MKRHLDWLDVESAARVIFNVFVDQPELRWARWSWDALGKAGLTAYEDALGRDRCKVRLLTLATLYREFCWQAFEERDEPDLTIWLGELDIEAVRIGQMIGSATLGGDDDYDLLESALRELVAQNRDPVRQALSDAWGGMDEVFVTMWLSNVKEQADLYQSVDDDDQTVGLSAILPFEIPAPIRGDVLNEDMSPEKHAAYEWVTSGMPSLFW